MKNRARVMQIAAIKEQLANMPQHEERLKIRHKHYEQEKQVAQDMQDLIQEGLKELEGVRETLNKNLKALEAM